MLRTAASLTTSPLTLWLQAIVLLAGLPQPDAFLEDMFQQAFGGQGGGGGFEFVSDGGGFHSMGGGGRKPKKPKWPKGVPTTISKQMAWMKGTEWHWDDWRSVKFDKDGSFDAPTRDCQQGRCLWSAENGQVYVLWGEAGLHSMKIQGTVPTEQNVAQMQGMQMKGRRASDNKQVKAVFQRVYDADAAFLDKDLYEALGLPDDAEEADVKKAYRKLSIKYHPDKNPNDEEAKLKFNHVRDAYEILNDPDKKILYDTGGMEAVKKHEKGEVETGDDVHSTIEATLEDLYISGQRKTSLQRRVVCRGCRVRPDSPKCSGCQRCPNEIQTVNVQVGHGMYMQQKQEVVSKEKCKREHTMLDVQIEKGMRDGEQIVFPRMAEQKPGILPGNVVLKVEAKKHHKFERRGDDLHMTMQVSLREALLGWTQKVRHLDGHIVEFGTSSVTKPDQVFRVDGEGMPLRDDPASFGNLYVKAQIVFPKKLDSAQMEKLAEVFPEKASRSEL